MRWLVAALVTIMLCGCRPAPVTHNRQPVNPTRLVFSPAGIESLAGQAYEDLEGKGVQVGALEAHGHGEPLNMDGRELQGYSLRHQGTYRSRRVSVNTWIQLVTEGTRTSVLRGRVIVDDPHMGEVLTVKL